MGETVLQAQGFVQVLFNEQTATMKSNNLLILRGSSKVGTLETL